MEVHRLPTAAEQYHHHTPHGHHLHHGGQSNDIHVANGHHNQPVQLHQQHHVEDPTGTAGRQMLYAGVPAQQALPQFVGDDTVHYASEFAIKTEFGLDDRPNVVISPTLKRDDNTDVCTTTASNVSTPTGGGAFHISTGLPLNSFHFAAQQSHHYANGSHMLGADTLLADMCGASSTSSSVSSSSSSSSSAASVASSKDATSGSAAAPFSFSYMDQPTTSASSASSSTCSVFVADRKRPYPCTLCPSKFGSKMELEEHQNSHTGMKPFQCDVCQSRFNRRSTLWNHKRIHSDAKPFVCTVCQMTFKWKNSLKCHKEMHYRKNETSSIQDNDVLTYATAAKKQMKSSNTTLGNYSRSLGDMNLPTERKSQRCSSAVLQTMPQTAAMMAKKATAGNSIRTTAALAGKMEDYGSVMDFRGVESVIRHPHNNYLMQQQQQQQHGTKRLHGSGYPIQQEQRRRQQLDESMQKFVIHNNNNNDNISDNNNDNGNCNDVRSFTSSAAPTAKSVHDEGLCGTIPPISHPYDVPFFALDHHRHAEQNSFDHSVAHSLNGVLPGYEEAFFNNCQILNPALLSAAAAAAATVNYTDASMDPFGYTNGVLNDGNPRGTGDAYGSLLHNGGGNAQKLFTTSPMTVIHEGTFAAHLPGSTATALVHEGGYLNYR